MKLSEFGKRLDQQHKNQQNEQGLGETIARHQRASDIFSQPQEFEGIDLGEYTSYTGDNINVMRDNIDELRAQNQSGWEQARNAISQAALGMTVGGGLEAFGYLMEVPRNIAAAFTDAEQNWEGNFLSNFGKGIREGIEEARPVHMTEQAQSGELSRFADSSWWWGNAPSIASTLSLMIPTMAVTRGVGAAARGIRSARQSSRPGSQVQPGRLTQSRKLQLETIGASFTQRHMYSTMESYDVYERSYKDAIEDGYSHEEAKAAASDAAATNYKLGYMNIWKDVIQWGTVLRGMNHANLRRGQTLAQRTKMQPDNSLLKRISQVGGRPGTGSRFSLTGRDSARGITPFGYASMAIGEGFEEFNIQWQKAYSQVLSKYNNDMLEEMPTFSEFMGEQVKDPYAWDAAIWGTFGGGLFGAVAPALARTGRKQQLEQEKQKLNRLIQTANVTRDNIKEYTDRLAKGDPESANFARENIIMKMGIEGAAEGDIALRREMFENISHMSDEQLAEIEMQPEARDYANQAIEQLDRIEQKYNQYANYDYGFGEADNALAQKYTELDFIKENQQKQYNYYSGKVNEARNNKTFRQNEMTPAARTYADNLKRKQVLEGVKTSMEQNNWRTNKEKNDFIELANKRLKQINEDLADSEQALSETVEKGKLQQQKKFAEMDANMHPDEVDPMAVMEQADIMIEYVDNERSRMSDRDYVQKLVDNRKKIMEGRSERINEQEDQQHAEEQDRRQEDDISDEANRQEQNEGEIKQSSNKPTSQKDNLNQDRSDPLTQEERENLKNYENILSAFLKDSDPSSKQIEEVLGSEDASDYLELKAKQKRSLKDQDQSGEQLEGESLNQSQESALNSLENKEEVSSLDETEQETKDRLDKKKTDTEPSVSDHSVGQSQNKSNRQNEDVENRQQNINVAEPPISRAEEAGSFNTDNVPKKGSIVSAAYKDPYYHPNEELSQWSQDFANWVNDPTTNIVGEQVTLEIDFDFLQSKFPEMYEKIQKGESLTNSELGSLPVMAKVDSANVYTYLHTDKFGEGPNGIHPREHDVVISRDNQDHRRYLAKTLEDQRSALRDIKGEILQAYQNNETVTTTISGQSKGLPRFIEGHQPLQINDVKLGMYNKGDIVDQNNKPLPIKTHAKVEGAIHVLIPASDGTMTTSSLQRSTINEQEASLVADALISVVKNEGTDAIQTQTMVGDQGGLTNQEIIDLFKYDNPKHRNVATIDNRRQLKVGRNTYDSSNIDNARNEIISELQKEFVNVRRDKLNEPLFKGLKNDQFQLFDNEFKKSDNYNYNDFVISNQSWRQEPLLQTNFDSHQYTHNNEPKVRYTGQSSVYFSKFNVPAYEVETTNKPVTSSEGKKSEQTSVTTVKVSQYNISIHEDGRMYFENGNEVVDQRIRNKALVEHERPQYPDRETTFDNSSYFVLQDDRIISLTKTNYGKEVFSKKSNDPSTVKKRNWILNQVEQVDQQQPDDVGTNPDDFDVASRLSGYGEGPVSFDLTLWQDNRMLASWKGDKFEIQIGMPWGSDKFLVSVSTAKSDSATGFTRRDDISREFDSPFEAIDYANKIARMDSTQREDVGQPVDSPEVAPQQQAQGVEKYRGLDVVDRKNISTQTGIEGAAKFDRKNNQIIVNRDLLQKKFDEKAWTKPRKLKDGSQAEALPENEFSTYQEFENFVLEHEYQHSLMNHQEFYDKIASSEENTLGAYETEINRRAIEALRKQEHAEPKQVQKPEKKQRRNFTPKNPGFRTQHSESQPYEYVDQTQAKNWLQSVLPNTPVHVVDKLINLSNDGTKAYGAFVMGADAMANIGYSHGIMMSNLQPSNRSQQGTEFHEAFHAVFRTYLSEAEINDLLAEARQEYGELNNEVLEERLAEDFRQYMLDTEYADTFTGKIKQFFQDLLRFVQDLFRGQRVKDRIFEQISTGRFADVQPLDSRSEAFVSDKVLRRVEIPGLSHKQVDSFVRMFTFGIFNENNLQDLSDIQNIVIDENSIGGFAQFAQDKARELGDTHLVERYEKVKDNIEYFVDAVKDHLQKKYSLRELEGDIEAHVLEHTDINRKDRATPNAKLLVATLPKVRHESDLTQYEMDNILGKKYEYNPDTGMPELVDFDATWNLISKLVSDIPNTSTENVNFSYERDSKASKIIDKLEKTGKYIPELNELADRLKDTGENALPEYKKQQFFSAISKARVNYTTTTVERHGNKNNIRSFDSATNSIENKLIRKWNQDLLFNSQIIKNGNRFNVNNAEQLINEFNNLRSRIKDEEIRSYNSVTTQNMEIDISESLLSDLSSILSELGINLNQNALDYHLDRMQIQNPDQTRGQLLNMLYRDLSLLFDPPKRASVERSLRTLIEEAKDSKKPIQADEYGNIETFMQDESIIRDLAESESIFHEHIGENMSLGAEGNKQYNYSLNSFLTETKNQIKESPEYLLQVQESVYGGNSKYAEYLLDEGRFQQFNVRQKQTIRELNAGDQGVKYAQAKPSDKFVDRVTNTIRGNIQILTPADKSRLFEMTGIPVINSFNGIDANGNIEFTSEVYETMIGYLIDELTRMKTVQTMIDNNRSGHLDENIHKNYQNITVMPSLSPDQISVSDNREMGLYHEGTKKPKPVHEVNLKSNRALRQHIKNKLNEKVQESINDAQRYQVVDENFKNFGFDSDMYNSYRRRTSSTKQAVQSMLTDYTINNIVGNIETTKLFTGDPAFYKDIHDLMKRVPEIIAPRQELMIDEYIGKTFEVAVLRDSNPASTIYDPSSEFFNENLEKFKKSLPRVVKKTDKDGNPIEWANDTEHDNRARDLLSAYSKMEETDAQAYISPHRWRKLMHGLGLWKKEYDASFNRLMNGTQTAEDVALVMQPIKGVYYNMEMDNQTGMMTPRYFKYSQMPLFPSLVENTTELKQLYDKMADQGIDEVMFETANKVGKTNINDLDADVLQTTTLSNEGWGLQQENPSKYHKEGQTNDGTQRRHNIYANIGIENSYNVESHPDGTLNGQSIYQHLQEADIEITRREVDKILEEFDAKDSEGNPRQAKNLDNFYNAVIDQLKEQNIPDNIIEQFERDALGGYNPFDSIIAEKEKIQNVISSMITSRTVDQKHQGGSFIQASVWGMSQKPTDYNALTQDQQNRIIWVIDDQLKPPRYENGEFKPGDIMIPYDAIERIQGVENMNHQQIVDYLNNDPSALEGIAYRIPNQGKASIDSVRITGILPKEMRDTIVMYPDVTTKTGSDFDIDKMYVALPHYRMTKDGIKRVEFHHVNEQEGATNEDLARIYRDRYEPIKALARRLEDRKSEIEQQAVEEGYSITEGVGEDFTTEMYEFFGKKNFDYKEYERVKNKATQVPTLNEFIDNNVGKSSFEVNSKSAIQNYKLELEQSILSSDHHFAEMMTPLDNPWLKNDIQKIYKGRDFNDFELFSSKYQLDYHQNQQEAGQTIGILANHLRDHAIAQMAGNTLSNDLRLFKREEKTRLDRITDEKGYFISDNMNSDINAVLDVAKDDFIVRANVNPFTANTYQLLRRTGMDREWTNRFIGQPIIRRLKELHDIKDSTSSQPLKINGKLVTPEQYVRHEFGNHSYAPVHPWKIPKNKMEDAIQRWLDGEVDQMSGSEQSFQLQVLDSFINIDSYAGKLNDAILASKADVTTPKNIQDAIISEHRLARLQSDKYGIVGFENRFNGTAIGEKYKASVQLLQQITDGLFLENTPGYRNAMENIFQNIKNQYPIRNVRMADNVKHEAFAYIASGSPMANLKQSEVYDLFFGDNSVAKRIFEVQKDENHPFHNTYLFRDFFEVTTSQKGPDIIRTNNTEIRNKDILSNEFYNLWSDENTRQLAEDIATISYYHSGFRQGMHSFHDIIDNRYIHHRDVDFGGYVEAMMGHMQTNNLEGFETQFYKHNADNKTYVPRLPQVGAERLYNNVKVGDTSLGSQQAFILNEEGIKQYAVAEGYEGRLVFPRFISRKEGQDIQLYEHIGDRYTAEGMNYYPVYRRTNKLGYNHRGVKIYEYNMQEDNPHAMQSIISDNNVEHAISDKMVESAINNGDIVERTSFERPLTDQSVPDVTDPSATSVPDNVVQERMRIC